jgi:hypothetical protein
MASNVIDVIQLNATANRMLVMTITHCHHTKKLQLVLLFARMQELDAIENKDYIFNCFSTRFLRLDQQQIVCLIHQVHIQVLRCRRLYQYQIVFLAHQV